MLSVFLKLLRGRCLRQGLFFSQGFGPFRRQHQQRQLFFPAYRHDRADIYRLLAIAGVTLFRGLDKSLIIPEFEHLRTEFNARPAPYAKIPVNYRFFH